MFYIRIFAILLLIGTLVSSLSAKDLPEQFREPFAKSFPIRERQHLELNDYLDNLILESRDKTLAYFNPDFSSINNYIHSRISYRQDFFNMIGYPPPGAKRSAVPRFKKIGEDNDCRIFRMWIEVMDGVEAYGICMVPNNLNGKAPLLVAIHGGSGCPEAICDIDTRKAYNAFGREAVKRGYIVWAPFLCMRVSYGGDPKIENAHRYILDKKAKLVGTSLVAIEIYKIIRSMEAIVEFRQEVDPDKVGVAGLSYGGYFTLVTTAASDLVKVALCSGIFREMPQKVTPRHLDYDRGGDTFFFNVFNKFSNAQLTGLICPRPLLIQNGINDPVVSVKSARREYPRAALYYKKLGVMENIEYFEHEGGHEFDIKNSFKFLNKYLQK